MKHCPLTDSLQDKSNPGMYFSTGRKVPKAHRGGQSVHEGVAAPDPPYPNTLRAHCRGAALITPRGGRRVKLGRGACAPQDSACVIVGFSGVGRALQRGDFAPAAATRGLSDRPLDSFGASYRMKLTVFAAGFASRRLSRAVPPAKENTRSGIPTRVSRGPKALRGSPEGNVL